MRLVHCIVCHVCDVLFLRLVYHGTEGPVVVDDMASTLLADKFVLAGQELGFEHVDVTAQKQFGEELYCWHVTRYLEYKSKVIFDFVKIGFYVLDRIVSLLF